MPPGSSAPSSGDPAEHPSFPRGNAPFPGSPAETPSFPHSSSQIGTPAETRGFPSAARPGDRFSYPPGESTEGFPSVYPGGGGPLPRRIPLSERTGKFPGAAPRDENAFRLFPPGDDTDAFPEVPLKDQPAFPSVPDENPED